jgi:hypothetical protein
VRKKPPLSGRDILLWQLSERQWQEQVVAWARRSGWLVFHTFDSRRSTGAGFPDLVLAKPGRMVVFAELKTMKGVISTSQREWIAALNMPFGGCQAFFWRPSDEDAIKTLLGFNGPTFEKG